MNLPDDIVLEIAGYLEIGAYLNVSATCVGYYRLLQLDPRSQTAFTNRYVNINTVAREIPVCVPVVAHIFKYPANAESISDILNSIYSSCISDWISYSHAYRIFYCRVIPRVINSCICRNIVNKYPSCDFLNREYPAGVCRSPRILRMCLEHIYTCVQTDNAYLFLLWIETFILGYGDAYYNCSELNVKEYWKILFNTFVNIRIQHGKYDEKLLKYLYRTVRKLWFMVPHVASDWSAAVKDLQDL